MRRRRRAGTARQRRRSKTLYEDKNNITIGMDCGDRRHAVCVLNAKGERASEELLTNSRGCLKQLSERYPGATLAIETGNHWPWVSRFSTKTHGLTDAHS